MLSIIVNPSVRAAGPGWSIILESISWISLFLIADGDGVCESDEIAGCLKKQRELSKNG